MTRYIRDSPCAVCGKSVIWDDEEKKLICGCGTFNATFVNLQVYKPLAKVDRKYWKSERLPLDSAKFLSNEMLLDGSNVLFISDRESIFKGNENPQVQLRWIRYPEKNKVQLCLAISGVFHTEKIAYNTKEVKEWNERMWIYISEETVKKMLDFLQRNPNSIASWM